MIGKKKVDIMSDRSVPVMELVMAKDYVAGLSVRILIV